MTSDDKAFLNNLISNGKIEEAIEYLLTLEIQNSKKQNVLAISSRFKRLKEKRGLGILSIENIELSENQITNDLIRLIDNSKETISLEHNLTKETKSRRNKIWKYITVIAVLIGILGSLAEVLNFINIIPNNSGGKIYQLSVFVTDIYGNVVLEHEGELNTSIGNRSMRERIGEDGRTNFGDILPQYLGDTITIGFKADGWKLVNSNNTFVFSGAPIKLKIKRDESLGVIKGFVKTRDGQKMIKRALIQIDTDTAIYTDSLGVFKIILPEKFRVEKISESYFLTVTKDGYKTQTQTYFPKSSNVEIRLEEN